MQQEPISQLPSQHLLPGAHAASLEHGHVVALQVWVDWSQHCPVTQSESEQHAPDTHSESQHRFPAGHSLSTVQGHASGLHVCVAGSQHCPVTQSESSQQTPVTQWRPVAPAPPEPPNSTPPPPGPPPTPPAAPASRPAPPPAGSPSSAPSSEQPAGTSRVNDAAQPAHASTFRRPATDPPKNVTPRIVAVLAERRHIEKPIRLVRCSVAALVRASSPTSSALSFVAALRGRRWLRLPTRLDHCHLPGTPFGGRSQASPSNARARPRQARQNRPAASENPSRKLGKTP